MMTMKEGLYITDSMIFQIKKGACNGRTARIEFLEMNHVLVDTGKVKTYFKIVESFVNGMHRIEPVL